MLPGKCSFDRTFLVLGGHYILTMTETNTIFLIKLWDIGFFMDSVTPSLPIVSTSFKEHMVVILGLQPITTGDGLLVMLEVMQDNR